MLFCLIGVLLKIFFLSSSWSFIIGCSLSVSGSASVLPSASSTQPTSYPHDSIGTDSHVDSSLHPIDASTSHLTFAVQSVYATRFINSSMYVQRTSSISRWDIAGSHSDVGDVPQFLQTTSSIDTHPSYQPSFSSAYVLQHSTASPAHTTVSDVTPTELIVQLPSSDFNIHSSRPNTITLSSSEAFSAGGGATAVQLPGMTPALPSRSSLEHTASIFNPTTMYSSALGEMASVVNAADHERSKQSSPSYTARSEIDEFSSKMLTVMSSSITTNGQTKVTSTVILSASTAYDGHAQSSQLTPGDGYSLSQPMLPGASNISDSQLFFLSASENIVSTPISTNNQINTDIRVTPTYSDEFTVLPSDIYQTGVTTIASVASVVISHGTLQPSSAITATDETHVTSIELPPHATVFGDGSGELDVSEFSSSLSYDDHRTPKFAGMSTFTQASFVDADNIYTVASPTLTSVERTTSSALWRSTEPASPGTVGVSQTRHDQTTAIIPSPLPSAWSHTTQTRHDQTTAIIPSPLPSAWSHTTQSETFQGAFDENASIMPSSLNNIPSSIAGDSILVPIQTVPALIVNPSPSLSRTESTSVSAHTSIHELPSASVASLNQSTLSFHDSATIYHSVSAVDDLGTSLYDQYLTVTPSFGSDSIYPERPVDDSAITSLHDDYLTVTPLFVSDTIYHTSSAQVGLSPTLFDQHLTVSPPFDSDTIYISRSVEVGLSSSIYDSYLTVSPSLDGTSIYPKRSSTGDHSSPFSDQYLTVTPSLSTDTVYLTSSPVGDTSTSVYDPYPTISPSLVSDTIYPESIAANDYSTSMYDSHLTVMSSVGSDTIYPEQSGTGDLSTSMYDQYLTVTPSLSSDTIYPKSSTADVLNPSMYHPTLTVTPYFVSEPPFSESSAGGEISPSMTDQYLTVAPSLGNDTSYHSSSVEDDFITSTYDQFLTATPSLDSDRIFPESSPIEGLVTPMHEQYSTVMPSVSHVSATLTTAATPNASMTPIIGGRLTTVITSATPVDLGSSVTSIPVYRLSSSLQDSIDGSATIMAWMSTPSSMLPSSATPSVSGSEQWSFVATATESLQLTSSVSDASTGISSGITATSSLPLTSSVPDASTGISSLLATAFLPITSSVPDATSRISSSLPASAISSQVWMTLNARDARLHVTSLTGAACAAHIFCTRLSEVATVLSWQPLHFRACTSFHYSVQCCDSRMHRSAFCVPVVFYVDIICCIIVM